MGTLHSNGLSWAALGLVLAAAVAGACGGGSGNNGGGSAASPSTDAGASASDGGVGTLGGDGGLHPRYRLGHVDRDQPRDRVDRIGQRRDGSRRRSRSSRTTPTADQPVDERRLVDGRSPAGRRDRPAPASIRRAARSAASCRSRVLPAADRQRVAHREAPPPRRVDQRLARGVDQLAHRRDDARSERDLGVPVRRHGLPARASRPVLQWNGGSASDVSTST